MLTRLPEQWTCATTCVGRPCVRLSQPRVQTGHVFYVMCLNSKRCAEIFQKFSNQLFHGILIYVIFKWLIYCTMINKNLFVVYTTDIDDYNYKWSDAQWLQLKCHYHYRTSLQLLYVFIIYIILLWSLQISQYSMSTNHKQKQCRCSIDESSTGHISVSNSCQKIIIVSTFTATLTLPVHASFV